MACTNELTIPFSYGISRLRHDREQRHDAVELEPNDDPQMDFGISFETYPPAGTEVHAQAKIQIDDTSIILP